ncbi:TetR/AcrR family transcriptional regulator [Paraclostridium ghonii]|uniref:TetR/AcrR family transcriptional regulator n=1 Tax=Paraclostridium ghonii TaxID=29358 RepID=UPI00202CCB7E|nr:TetR/AcrR family transcriptional regulator [Paeniclostridium ghonii]MCM0165480.1 TetR/AcrR family transcriptional regulator [Paeniclostridium ghonii]
MQEKPYHHGNLHNELIEKGISLINEEGISNFSLRKVAKLAGVSATACYNHFSNKEELLDSMKSYVSVRFAKVILDAAESSEGESPTIDMGKAYVKFFADNPHYFSFIYDNEDYCIELNEDDFIGDYKAFCIFRDVSIACMEKLEIPKIQQRDNLVAMWAMVQGLSSMANMKGFHYKGDWCKLTETILENKLNFR